jgi:hypothetical protein
MNRKRYFYKDGRMAICGACGMEFRLRSNHPKQKYCSHVCSMIGVNEKYITKEQLLDAIDKTEYRKDAAALLGVTDKTVSTKLKKYGLKIPIKCYKYSGFNGNGYPVTYGKGNRKDRVIHRMIAQKVLGRELTSNEVVHHINMDKTDNRNENLLICTNNFHRYLHHLYAKRYAELFLR